MNDEKNIDEFLNKFNKMTDTFGKTSELKKADISNESPPDLKEEEEEENFTTSISRLERLQRSKSKSKSDLSSVKQNLSKNYYSNPETPKISNEFHESTRFRDKGESPNVIYNISNENQSSDTQSLPVVAKDIKIDEDKMASTKTKGSRLFSKKKKSNNSKNSKKKKIFIGILLAILALSLIGIIFLATIILTAEPINSDNIYSRLSEHSIMYDDEGNVIDNIVSIDGLRANVSFQEMPEDLINAIIAIEDKTFWEHKGFNFIRIFGAIKESIFEGGGVSGTSTLTQQLARNIYLAEQKSDRTLDRKLREAYYAILLEKHLSKEEILEVYLNTVYFGFSRNGVQAASQAYFSKNVSELTLAECATLASLPQLPGSTALIQTLPIGEVAADDPKLLHANNEWAFVYNDAFEDRKDLVLFNMKEQNKIGTTSYNEAVAYDMFDSMKIGEDVTRETTSYFADYVTTEVIEDLMESLNLSEDDAQKKVYNGGLRIHTTMSNTMQNTVESEFTKNNNFPSVYTQSSGNILDSTGNIMLYDYNNYFNSEGNFVLTPDEYSVRSDGSIVVYKDKRLDFHNTTVREAIDISVEFKSMYFREDGTLYANKGGFILIEQKYKSKDSQGNLVISPQLNIDYPDFLTFGSGGLVVTPDKYTLRQKTIQPQSAMVILDYKTGEIKAMVGGRGVEGRFLFNRADEPRQTGSSIKPIGAYGPALQASVDQLNGGAQAVTDKTEVYGAFWTAASAINDSPIKLPSGESWPRNFDNRFGGLTSMRKAIEQSINTTAVKVFNDIGAERSVEFAKELGITTIVETGAVSDLNPAAMALGGMTYGVSPLEMAGAFGTFANAGTYVSPSSYSTVTNKKGETILEAKHESRQVMDKGVAFIMTDMLNSSVNLALSGNAKLSSQPVAGKTGTTTNNYDAWFVGYTPQYVGSVWIGNDVNLQLSQGSMSAAALWRTIMQPIHADIPRGTFVKPDNVISAYVNAFNGHLPSGGGSRSEFFVQGTQPSATFKGSYPAGVRVPIISSPAVTSPEENIPIPPEVSDENNSGIPPTPSLDPDDNNDIPPNPNEGIPPDPDENIPPNPDENIPPTIPEEPDTSLPPSWVTTE